jgi:hypothetical protein
MIVDKAERVLSATNQSGTAIRQTAWRIAVESWLKSMGFIKVHINQKCHPISPLF